MKKTTRAPLPSKKPAKSATQIADKLCASFARLGKESNGELAGDIVNQMPTLMPMLEKLETKYTSIKPLVLKVQPEGSQGTGCDYDAVRFIVRAVLYIDSLKLATIATAFGSTLRLEDTAAYWIAVAMAQDTKGAVDQPWVERYVNRLIEHPLRAVRGSPAVDTKIPEVGDLYADYFDGQFVFNNEKADMTAYLAKLAPPAHSTKLKTTGSFAPAQEQTTVLQHHPWLCSTVEFTTGAPSDLMKECTTHGASNASPARAGSSRAPGPMGQ